MTTHADKANPRPVILCIGGTDPTGRAGLAGYSINDLEGHRGFLKGRPIDARTLPGSTHSQHPSLVRRNVAQ